MARKKTWKAKTFKCAKHGCSNRHKNSSGFCAEHAHLIDKQYVKPRDGTFVSDIYILKEKQWLDNDQE